MVKKPDHIPANGYFIELTPTGRDSAVWFNGEKLPNVESVVVKANGRELTKATITLIGVSGNYHPAEVEVKRRTPKNSPWGTTDSEEAVEVESAEQIIKEVKEKQKNTTTVTEAAKQFPITATAEEIHRKILDFEILGIKPFYGVKIDESLVTPHLCVYAKISLEDHNYLRDRGITKPGVTLREYVESLIPVGVTATVHPSVESSTY
jgi:hypothetical protein